ncbi:MAG: hypothetical protein WC726_03905 [Parcubacteria group bacterium]|jgi:hypothetical protein
MVPLAVNGLAGRIVAVEDDSLTENLDDINLKLQEILDGKRNPDERSWFADRLQWTEERIECLRQVKKQVAAGEFRSALFAIMERLYFNEYRASSRIMSDDPRKVADDLKERITYYQKALEYVKISNELFNLMVQ